MNYTDTRGISENGDGGNDKQSYVVYAPSWSVYMLWYTPPRRCIFLKYIKRGGKYQEFILRKVENYPSTMYLVFTNILKGGTNLNKN